MNRYLRFRSRSCLIWILIQLVFVLLILCVLASLLFPLSSSSGSADQALLLIPAAICGLAAVISAGVIAWGVWANRSRAIQLDQAFQPYGLVGSQYLTIGRQFHGVHRRRNIDVYFNRGPTLEIYVSTPVRTRLGIGTRNLVASLAGGLTNRQPLQTDDPDYAGLYFYPLDEAWSRKLIADPQVKAAILRMVADDIGPGAVRSLILRPGALHVTQRYFHTEIITPENVHDWMEDLFTIVEAAERLPDPEFVAEPGRLERYSQANRGKLILPAILITLVLISGPLLCVGLFLGLLALGGQFP